ncbi:MAG: T9SS type A sorting domain-containing protein [Bacteroidia bacterium]
MQDSDNDGLADDSLTQIMNPSPWFTLHENDLIQHFSSYGDQLEDKMTANFQDGDSSGGYNYVQLRNIGLTLPFLQLSRIIPAGLDTMNAFPLEFTFYIDTIMSSANCIDCDGFSLNPNITRTLYKLNVSGANLNQYLDIFQSENRLLFTFDGSIDSLDQLIGNLASNSPYIDPNYPFKGYYEGQRYRLKVRYANCGNFIGNNGDHTTLESAMIKSEITNKMWLCGTKQDHDNPQMYNTVEELRDSLNMTVYPIDTSYQLIDTSYTNNHLFFCETFGGVHYFFSQDARNFSILEQADGCNKSLLLTARMVAAGYPYAINMYPFEYRPPMLWPTSYEVNVPAGYYVNNLEMRHQFFFVDSSDLKFTKWIPLPLPNTVVGHFTFLDNTLPSPVCFSDSLYPFLLTDTNMYVITGRTDRVLKFTLSPLSCDSSSNIIATSDSIAIIRFDNHHYNCIDTTTCSLAEITRRTDHPENNGVFTLLPNLIVQTSPITINVTGNRICTELKLSNYSAIIDGISTSTASNVFLALPDTLSVPFLYNWVYYSPDTIYPLGQIIQIDTLFNINQTDTGLLCASIINCYGNFGDTATFTFHTGWNCDGFPNSPFDADSVCGAMAQTITLIKEDAELSNSAKAPNTNSIYALCDTIFAHADFTSTKSGYLYPNFVKIDTILGLGILAVYLKRDTASVLLTYNSSNQNFPITAGHMISLGFSDSAFYSGSMIRVEVLFIPTCNFIEDSLPFIQFNAIDYCGIVHNTTATYDGLLDIEGSKCHDCFTLNKTASDSTIAALDTMSFNIIICPNNYGPSWVGLTELLPANFFATSTIPTFVYIDSVECDTVVIEGYFTQAGPCIDNTNIAKISYLDYDSLNQLTFLSDTITASACIDVSVACVDTSTIIFLANDSSHNYAGVYNNNRIYVEGVFTIDNDLTLVNCQMYTAAGAHILVTRDALFDLDSTVILGCDSMWQGVTLTEDSKLKARNNSCIQDAVIGTEMLDATQALFEKSKIINSVLGVKVVGPIGGIFPGYLTISEATFGMFSSTFKPNYIWQPSHGVLPYAGIDMNDAVMVLGDGGAGAPSYFYRMNKGIVGLRTQMEIVNCKFNGISFDNFYHTASDGSAVVSEGDLSFNPSYLQLMPVNYPDTTILNSHRGVYNAYSDLIVQYCIMNNVRTGVECSGNKFRQYALVTDNIINATLYGALFINNAGADYNIIAGNLIKVHGLNTGVGIAVREAKNSVSGNYDIAWNHSIRMVDGTSGIELLNAASPQVRCNLIKMDAGDEQAKSSTGITVLGCNSATITQNSITGYTRSNTSRRGLSCDVSTSCQIGCNSVDSTGYGFHFGSSNLFTNFRGNKMKSHLEGLHLNTTAVIDTQGHAGNQWLGNYAPWFGTVNMNAASPLDVRKSLFVVDPNLGSTYNPNFPVFDTLPPYVDNTGWFDPQIGGGTYTCPNASICYESEYVSGEGSPSLLAMIALDSILSVDYIEESQSIAQLMLYEKLMRDTALTGSDIVFQNFIYNEPILHNLYEARLSLQEYGDVSDSLAAVLLSMDSTIKSFGDSIRYYLNLQMETQLNYNTIIAEFRASLNISRNIYASVIQQLRYENNAILAEAGFYNSLVDNVDELPLLNEEVMNEIEIAFEEGGIEGIDSYREQISEIAFQCPYQGGQGVFRARFFLSLFNDSIEYDDVSVCLAQGISKVYSSTEVKVEPHLFIKPNPAIDETEVFLIGVDNAGYQLKIISQDGRVLQDLSLKYSLLGNKLNTSFLLPGVYYLVATTEQKSVCRTKLVIVR